MVSAGSNYTYISSGTTTVIGPAAATISLPTTGRRINLLGIGINKTLTGTVTVKSGSTTIGVIAIGTLAGTYWQTQAGIEVTDLQITTSAADDVTIFWNNF